MGLRKDFFIMYLRIGTESEETHALNLSRGADGSLDGFVLSSQM